MINLNSLKSQCLRICSPFTGCSASDARDRSFSASWEACRYNALLGFTQAPGFAGGHDSLLRCCWIAKRWKENSIAEFETELITAENIGDTCLIEKIITKMEKIDNNQIKFEYPIINLIVALSTVLINIINVTVSIPSIYEFLLSIISQEWSFGQINIWNS